MEITMAEDDIELKIEDILGTLKNVEGGHGKLIVGVSKAMEEINDLILKHKKNEQPPSISEETLYTMLTIVGREVDLHTKNGDVYAGIFYVASPKTDDIGIQLKQCKLGNGITVDTQDIALSQISKIVAKGVTVLVEDLGWSLLKTDDEKEKQPDTNYQIDIQKIASGEDTRSSLIIRNIPK
ncbi:putative GPI-anchored protein PB15E9.01c-like, partial [Trifolium medium]|nr:putative GPI-anchored protein PB15E9.01c-like [Trifolium medium]